MAVWGGRTGQRVFELPIDQLSDVVSIPVAAVSGVKQ